MASSDDEEEVVLNCVENYHFEDEKQEPISFTVLPIQWTETDSPGTTKNQIFLHGTADSGLQKVYKQVMAWKLDLSGEKPTIYVLTKDNIWMQLQKPRKSFEETIRTILVTVYFLHFASKNKDTSEKAIWDHLRKVFSTHEVSPSEHDLSYHLSLIRGMAQRDEMLANSKLFNGFLIGPVIGFKFSGGKGPKLGALLCVLMRIASSFASLTPQRPAGKSSRRVLTYLATMARRQRSGRAMKTKEMKQGINQCQRDPTDTKELKGGKS
ncbi:hypothetical protein AMTR_s00055p00188210 [Amborella trichopoda]|uniref:RFTS domain-containing protein n=1 Tax=Amborella trichopoda TaxID=13333 RepID=U5DA72_AMBTC|nr:hypothetical protein AMTR_s00055p00188210 [Amborella trichopoda]